MLHNVETKQNKHSVLRLVSLPYLSLTSLYFERNTLIIFNRIEYIISVTKHFCWHLDYHCCFSSTSVEPIVHRQFKVEAEDIAE